MNIINLDLNLLIVFNALYKYRSVSTAALELHLSQPTISHALNRLRDSFDDELFIRSHKKMNPTVKALELGPFIEQQLRILEKGLFNADDFNPKTSTNEFNICGSDYDLGFWMPEFLSYLETHGPNIRMALSTIKVEKFFEKMSSGEVDLSLAAGLPESSSYNIEVLAHHKYCVLTRNENKKVKKRLSLKQYVEMDHMLFTPTETAGGIVDDALAKHGMKRNVALRVPYIYSTPWLLLERDFLITVPESFANSLLEYLPLKKLSAPLEISGFDHQMIWHKRTDKSKEHMWLRDQVRKFAR